MLRRTSAAAWGVMSLAQLALGGCRKTPAGTTAPVTVEVTTLAYGSDGAYSLDLHTPSAPKAEALATVVLAHGGLWQGGDKSALSALCNNIVLASEGTQACATINYRLSQDAGGVCSSPGVDSYRAQVTDLAAAFVYLQNEADRYGLNGAAMYVGGHSAGGHLSHIFHLRSQAFAQTCTHPSGCPAPRGAIGFEGIYDIAAWDAYDASFWGGSFSCATRKAFGAPASEPPACMDGQLDRPCWDAGSPAYLASHAAELSLSAPGHVLLIHSPGDDWVDITEAGRFGETMRAAFPKLHVITSTDGSCATGQHNDPLTQSALAECIVRFIASEGASL